MTEIIVQVVLLVVIIVVAVMLGHIFYLGIWRQSVTIGTFICYEKSQDIWQIKDKEGRLTWIIYNKTTGEWGKCSAELFFPTTKYWYYWSYIL